MSKGGPVTRPVMHGGRVIGQSFGPIVVPTGDEAHQVEQAVVEVTEDYVLEMLGRAIGEGDPVRPMPGSRTWAAIGAACGFESQWWPSSENIGAFLRGYGKATDDASARGAPDHDRWMKFKCAHAALIVLVAHALDLQKDGVPAYRKLFVFDSIPPKLSAPDAKDHNEFEDVLRKNKTLTGEDIVSRIYAAPPAEESLDRLGDALDKLGVF